VNPETVAHISGTQRFLRVLLNASAIEGVRLNSIKLHLNGNVSAAQVTAHVWWDKDKSGTVNAGDVELGNGGFGSGDVTISGSPLFTIAAGGREDLVITIQLSSSATAGNVVGVEVSALSFVGATGAVSTLGISPTGAVPVASTTWPITT
jgi:hypothetical protein